MKKLIVWSAVICLAFGSTLYAQKTAVESDEGMWLPFKAKTMNATDMKAKGLEVEIDKVYNEEKPSLKDAIVQLGGFCTGEMISPEGLMLTNHHCAFDAIASQSTTDHDYLTDGFWSMKKSEELPIEGLTATFLISSKDVTEEVLSAGKEDMRAIQEKIASIEEGASQDGKYKAEVKPFYNGLEYYLMVYEVYRDVRLVGAPPSSIGKFGGDTDNWMWPRQTGDFSLFRVYSGADNRPADFSASNKPFNPKHFLPISIKGVEKGDYSMVMGYPGSTDRYLSASDIDLAVSQTNGDRYMLMGQKLKVMKKYMDADAATRIALASQYASTSNYFKYLEGQTTMLNRYDIVGVKKNEEASFKNWANSKPELKTEYGTILDDLDKLNKSFRETDRFMSYINFGMFSSGAATNALGFYRLGNALESKKDDEAGMKEVAKSMKDRIGAGFKGYDPKMDKEIFYNSLLAFYENIPAKMYPPVLNELLVSKKAKKGKTLADKLTRWTDYAFETSLATSESRAMAFLDNPSMKVLEKDPLANLVDGVLTYFRSNVLPEYQASEGQATALQSAYLDGMRKMHPDKQFYPDANFTMRLTYGKISPYSPEDGVLFESSTTLAGVMEKEDPSNPGEFTVPAKLKELYHRKDYGRYGEGDEMPVCFLSTNDITGGNSGSPVINSKGELIGCAFDGNWEAMASDIYVFPEVTRTISVDARYILFIIDKFAGASHLLDEMTIVGASE